MYGNGNVLSTKTKFYSSWLTDILYIFLALGVFYALWLGGYALFTPDEGRYSEIAREMVVTGDYITPRLNGVAFLDKPIFYYWLQASAIQLFGLKEWALRFWPAMMGILGCLVTYVAGYTLFNRRTGLLAAIILATSPLYYGAAHYANLDLEVAVLISITLVFSALALHTSAPRKRLGFLLAAYLFCGLAALTKGLIGIVFPMMIIGSWIVLLNRWHVIKHLRLVTGLVIFVTLTVPWYYLVQQANPQFLHFFFVTQQVSRFLTHGDYNNQATLWFYLPIVLAGFFPWSVFIVQSIVYHIKQAWHKRTSETFELFLLLWFSLIFIFFSIPKSKTIGYILPIFPALALMVSHYLDRHWERAQTIGFRIGTLIFIFFSLLMTLAATVSPSISALEIPPETIPALIFTACLFLFAALLCGKFWRRTSIAATVYCFILTAGLGLLTLAASAININQKSIKPVATQLRPLLTPDDEVVTYYKYYQDLPIYLERRISIVENWTAPDIINRDNWVREMWFGMQFQDTQDWLLNEKAFWQRWHGAKRLFVLMDESDYPQFIRKAGGRVYNVGRYRDVVWVSNH